MSKNDRELWKAIFWMVVGVFVIVLSGIALYRSLRGL